MTTTTWSTRTSSAPSASGDDDFDAWDADADGSLRDDEMIDGIYTSRDA